jgi:hypothetical protein
VRGLEIGDWSEVEDAMKGRMIDLDGRMEGLGVCGGAEYYAPVSTVGGLGFGRVVVSCCLVGD